VLQCISVCELHWDIRRSFDVLRGRRHSIIFITLLRLLLVVLRVVQFVSTAASFWISDFDGKCIPTRQIARLVIKCLQCFDAVGWAAGRASGL